MGLEDERCRCTWYRAFAEDRLRQYGDCERGGFYQAGTGEARPRERFEIDIAENSVLKDS
jgi:hypothetical protein